MFEVHQVTVHIFGIPKCLQQCEKVDTNEVGITVIIITLKHMHVFLLKSARIGTLSLSLSTGDG
jgi:hypothetical protein